MMNLESVMPCEISQKEKDKHYIVSLIYEIKKKKCQTYINSRKVATKGWGQGENRQRLVKGYKFEKKKKSLIFQQ